MIEAQSDFAAVAERLAARATRLAKARIARRRTTERWRSAQLLWPLFPKG